MEEKKGEEKEKAENRKEDHKYVRLL